IWICFPSSATPPNCHRRTISRPTPTTTEAMGADEDLTGLVDSWPARSVSDCSWFIVETPSLHTRELRRQSERYSSDSPGGDHHHDDARYGPAQGWQNVNDEAPDRQKHDDSGDDSGHRTPRHQAQKSMTRAIDGDRVRDVHQHFGTPARPEGGRSDGACEHSRRDDDQSDLELGLVSMQRSPRKLRVSRDPAGHIEQPLFDVVQYNDSGCHQPQGRQTTIISPQRPLANRGQSWCQIHDIPLHMYY